MKGTLKDRVAGFMAACDGATVCSIDVETLVADTGSFLSGERIIAISFAVLGKKTESFVFVAESDTDPEEMRILRELDMKLAEFSPEIIIGYNHTGYDIPLIMGKTRSLSHEDRTRNIEFFLGTSWCLDMKYLIAEDLYKSDGYYRVRKLDDVLVHERYRQLGTMNAKDLVKLEGMDKGQAIKHLWQNDREKFLNYSLGDAVDLIIIFEKIMDIQP